MSSAVLIHLSYPWGFRGPEFRVVFNKPKLHQSLINPQAFINNKYASKEIQSSKKKTVGNGHPKIHDPKSNDQKWPKEGGGAEGGAEFAVCALFADVDEILWQSSRGTWGDVSCKPWLVPPLGTDTSNGLVENFG